MTDMMKELDGYIEEMKNDLYQMVDYAEKSPAITSLHVVDNIVWVVVNDVLDGDAEDYYDEFIRWDIVFETRKPEEAKESTGAMSGYFNNVLHEMQERGICIYEKKL